MAERESEGVGSAARALASAAAALSKALGQGVRDATSEAGEQLTEALRSAADELTEASAALLAGAGDEAATRRRSRARETRARLLEAAQEVFAARGYEGASVGDVAAAAGYTKGAVYAHFRGKEELLFAIAEELSAADGQRVAQAGSPAEALEGSTSADEALRCTLLTLEIHAYAVRHPDSRKRLGPLLGRAWEQAARLLASARTDGDPDAEPSRRDFDAALTLISLANFAPALETVLGDGRVRASADREIARILGEAARLAPGPDHPRGAGDPGSASQAD